MPPVRSARNRKPPPDGFDDIEDTLLEFSNKMKDAENASHEGKKRQEVLWPIFQITHQRRHLMYPYCNKAYVSLQDRDTYMSYTMIKRLYQSSCTNGYSRMGMPMAT